LPYNNALVSENFWKLFFQNPENPHKHWVFWHFQKVCPYLTQADDLGRVVIPKEIRRTMRIREGDPLEIFTDQNGEVILKKYSPVGEMGSFASQYADVLSKATGLTTVVCDRDHVIAVSGGMKKELLERRVSSQLEDLMESRRTYVASKDGKEFFPIEGVDKSAWVASPIVSSGDVSGAVLLLSGTQGTISEGDSKLCTVASAFLGKQMEE